MTKKQKKRMGRPPIEKPASALVPSIRVTPEQIKAYKAAAKSNDLNLSQWVRMALDKEAGEG